MSGFEPRRFSAPGKLFLIGEYAVREGYPALVMPVDRYVHLSRTRQALAGDDLPNFACSECERLLGLERSTAGCLADSSRLLQGGVKLGLGSSAAVCACAVASVFDSQGRDVEDDRVRFEMWRISRRVHDRFQEIRGSGADLAASLFGRTVVVDPRADAGIELVDQAAALAGLKMIFLWTGQPSSTPRLVSTVDAWRHIDPAGYRAIIDEMGMLSQRFAASTADPGAAAGRRLLPIIAGYGELMDKLGRLCGVPIVDSRMRTAVLEARRAGGALKPSGAGGGDVLLAMFPAGADLGRFLARMSGLGLRPVDLGPARHGVRAEAA